MDSQWEFFFNIQKKFWGILGYFWYSTSYLLKFWLCVSLVCDISITNTFFLQKVEIFIYFTGFSIWVWDMVVGCIGFGILSSYVRSPWESPSVVPYSTYVDFYLSARQHHHSAAKFKVMKIRDDYFGCNQTKVSFEKSSSSNQTRFIQQKFMTNKSNEVWSLKAIRS